MSDLATELTLDPLGRVYAQMSIAQIVADLTERRYPASVVSIQSVDAYFDNHLLRFGLKQLRDNAEAPQIARAAADTALELRTASYNDIRVDVAGPLLDVLVAAGVLTATHKAELLALADNQRTRCDVLGIDVPATWDVERALNNGE